MTSSKRPGPTHLRRFASTGSNEIQESIYEDPDSGAVAGGQTQNQMEVKLKPIPAPRIRSHSMDHPTSTDYESSIHAPGYESMRPSAYTMPRPVRLPPAPPVPANVNPTAPDSRQKKTPPPLPFRPHLSPSSHNYNNQIYKQNQAAENNVGSRQLSRCPSINSTGQGPVLSAVSEEESNSSNHPTQLKRLTHPSTPSNINNHGLRAFPSYLEVFPNESNVKTESVPPTHQESDHDEIYNLTTEDLPQELEWLKRMSREPEIMTPLSFGLKIEEEIRFFNKRATALRKARRLYNLLMMKRKESLQNIIKDFISISEKLLKVKKVNKKMGIAGGTTGAVGGVAVVVGVALAPVTLGTSLVATAVGAGMVASAGGLGIHAAKVNRKSVKRVTMEEMINSYISEVDDIEFCLQFMFSVINELQRHDIVKLQRAGAHPDALRMVDLSQSLVRNMNNNQGVSHTSPAGLKSVCQLKTFTTDIDENFTENNKQKLPKAKKGKFATKVCTLAKTLQEELDHLIKIWEMLC